MARRSAAVRLKGSHGCVRLSPSSPDNGGTVPEIPASIDEVTSDWLSEATGLDVSGVEETRIIGVGVGVSSAVYRLLLSGDDVPDSLVLKLKALDEAAIFTSSILRMYEREVKFFDEIADLSPIRVPKGYGGQVSEDGSSYYLLMEDMGGHRLVDQNEGMDLIDAQQCVDELAAWHAAFWGKAERYVESGAAVSLGDEVYPAVLPLVFGEGWEKIKSEMEVHPAIAEAAPAWTDALPSLLTGLCAAPTTVIHGDYRADNIFFDDDGKVVLLDFQLTGLATGSYDLSYFVTQSLMPDVAADNEKALFDRYVAGLIAGGVPESETARLWDDYRVGALFCLVYPVVAARGMDLSDPRQHALIHNMNVRFARALVELELSDLL